MNILLTNDDGINSKGILLLKNKLEKYGRIVISAPKNHMSAKSASVTLGKGFNVEQIENDVFAVDGTPVDCVSFTCNALNIDFDLVISGCNDGFNLSYDTIYSGTVGAGLEACRNHLPAIAFSCNSNFEIVEKYFDEVMEFILKKKLLSKNYLLNVNFPNGEDVKGIKISSLYYRDDNYYFVKEKDGYHAYRNCQIDFSDDINSDCYLVNHSYISITPLNKTYFDRSIYNQLIKKINMLRDKVNATK